MSRFRTLLPLTVAACTLAAGTLAAASALATPALAGSRPAKARPAARPAASRLAEVRAPGYVADPTRPLGAHDPNNPIKHIVIVMQENHSFDQYLGMLPVSGQPLADGFTFDSNGVPTNSNPVAGGKVQTVFHRTSLCPGDSAGQSWNNTHAEIDGGKMDGFAQLDKNSMSYYTQADLPFYYSLATQYTLANRWFASAPAQTYPNRRFLYAGTAYGNLTTSVPSLLDDPPPHGTIQDQMSAHGVSWKDYATNAPNVGIVGSNVKTHPTNITQESQFFVDAKLGTLPSVSYVDSGLGVAGEALGPTDSTTANAPTAVQDKIFQAESTGTNEEGDDVRIGQKWVSRVVKAVTSGPDWGSTLLIWLYDEHGGFYDHAVSPKAIAPDDIKPQLKADDVPGGYDQLGIRVPAVIVSAYSKPHAVSNVVHDHTSVLAQIERLWNLPALTYRDANAADLSDFLDLSHPSMMTPPTLSAPGSYNLDSCHRGQ